MCGIAGFELGSDDEEVAQRLLRRLARRGPDGSWFKSVAPYGLVQTRLSVIDLSDRVRYPLQNESGDLHLLFNGEVYEHAQHRAELERRGHRFRTDCDAEVMLHGYEEWGISFFARIDGMFALALLERQSGELLIARDLLGIKPLVYTTKGRFAFSSDAIALVAAGLSDGTIDEAVIDEYLAFHYVVPPLTGLRDVVQLEPGEALRRRPDGTLTAERWRARPFTEAHRPEPIEPLEAAELLDRSVTRQLVADVPVGVFLSSGLDSSLTLDSAVRSGARPTAFTIGFPGHGDYDEVRSASRFATELGVPHVVGEVSGGFAETVARISEAADQPLADASMIATLQLAKLARRQITVALSGTGGDDLFAGYYRHRAHLVARAITLLPAALRRELSAIASKPGGERRSMLALARTYAARLASLESGDRLSQYLELVGSASSELGIATAGARPSSTARERVANRLLKRDAFEDGSLRQIQAFELASYLPGDLLVKEDRATMAVGLEARVPLLGLELLELAERVPDSQKIGLFSGKRLLRDLARQRLPSYLAHTRKRGFAVPLADMFAGPWRRETAVWFADAGSSLVDSNLAAARFSNAQLPATDAWALAALIGWEQAVSDARREASSPDSRSGSPSVRVAPARLERAGVARTAQSLPLRIIAQSAYPQIAAGARVRLVEMGAHLGACGIDLEFRPSMSDAEYAVIATPGVSPHKAFAFTRGLVRSARVSNGSLPPLTLVHRLRSLVPGPNDDRPLDVYDFDDALYLGAPTSHHARLARLKQEARRSVRYMRMARLVIAGNRVLADAAQQHAKRVEIVPSCVDPSLQLLREHRDVEQLTLGWIGSATTSRYLDPMIQVIQALRNRGQRVQLLVMGASATMQAPWIEHRAWSVEAEREMLTEVDVGLMPLPDDPWARGKCGYKLLRYFAAGLPTIASPVGVNSELLAGGGGLSASSDADWARAIEQLAPDVQARREIGAQARSYVEREYSYQVWAPRFAELIRGLA